MRTKSLQQDGVRGNSGVGTGIRRTTSSTLSNNNILECMVQDHDINIETTPKVKAISSSASSGINVIGSRMITRMFISCIIFVIGTIHYGNVSIMKNESRNNVNHYNQIAGMFLNYSTEKKQTTTEKTTQPVLTMTESSKASISTFVRNEMKRLESSRGINNCSINSETWLNSTRYGNINHNDDDTYLTHDLVQHMILNLPNALVISEHKTHDTMDIGSTSSSVMPTVLQQTICHEQSRFLQNHNNIESILSTNKSNKDSPAQSSQFDEPTIRLWAMKLIYLGIHYHQHRLAVPEAVVRYNTYDEMKGAATTHDQCPTTSPQQLEQEYNVGMFDYECPDAKYIVMPLGGNGLGSNVRGGMVVGLLIGLITDRVVLFVNNVKGAGYHMDKIWSLASCPRKDYQCFFWPTSPCTITHDEIKNAHALTRDDYRKVIKGNDQLKYIEQHKVWVFNTPFLPVVSLPTHAAETLYQHAMTMITAVSKKKHPRYHALLMEAVETIRVPDELRKGYNYAAANTKVQHALAFYAMRPNPQYAHELDLILKDIIPETFPPETSIGLPIRGTYTRLNFMRHETLFTINSFTYLVHSTLARQHPISVVAKVNAYHSSNICK